MLVLESATEDKIWEIHNFYKFGFYDAEMPKFWVLYYVNLILSRKSIIFMRLLAKRSNKAILRTRIIALLSLVQNKVEFLKKEFPILIFG